MLIVVVLLVAWLSEFPQPQQKSQVQKAAPSR
jgi:hypothetical protein